MQTIESQALAKIDTTPQPAQVQAWVQLAQNKNELVQKLGTSELALQKILLEVNVTDHKAIDEALAVYRKAHTELIGERKVFTNIIEANIVQPLMQFEKRSDPKVNTLYNELSATSLSLRQQAAKQAAEFQALENEKNAFKNHVTNEYLRIEADFLQRINDVIDKEYSANLMSSIKEPDLKSLEDYIKVIKPDTIRKFDFVKLSREEMKQMFDAIPAPNYNQLCADKIAMLPSIFINYASDLANAAAAIEQRELDAKIAAQETAKKLEAETAINTLVSNASTPIVEVPKIKVELKIEVINSPEWAQLIMTQFIANLPTLIKYVRVQSWDKLTIGQMSTAIAKHGTETGETFKGIVYSEVCK